MGFGLALLLAFIGGAILNLMPCVFPVLSIKVLAFIDMAQGHKGHVRRHGLLFALGILVSFWALSGLMLLLQQAGAEIGWGFQLQSPGFVVVLCLLLFLLALNLFGLFEIGGTVMRLAGNADTGSGYSSSFFTGVLAAAVATPCTAPFMGAALGYALTQPAQVTLLIFTALALGLASPYLLLAEIPGLLEKLPRPGAWMVTFRQLLAFPLLASAIWLGWVLGHQQGVDAVAALLLAMLALALAAWLHGMQQHRASRRRWLDGIIVAVLLLQIPLWQQMTGQQPMTGQTSAASATTWEAFDADKLAAYRANGEAVFIDFTAAWCITCQVNKKLALTHEDVIRHFADNRIRTIRADWTRQDPTITAALAAVGRNGVPTYLYYDRTGATHLLPELLTAALVIDAVR
jgi:thiol:disulfide interchange protein DsbD